MSPATTFTILILGMFSFPALAVDSGPCQKLVAGLAATSAPPEPPSHCFETLSIRPDHTHPPGYIYRVKLKTEFLDSPIGTNAFIETGIVRVMVSRHPKLAADLGFKVEIDNGGATILEYPDFHSLNARLQLLGDRVSPLRAAPDRTTEGVGAEEFCSMWSEGLFPYSVRGLKLDSAGDKQYYSLHYHDIFYHAWGYIFMPRRIADVSVAWSKFILMLSKHEIIKANPQAKQIVLEALQEFSKRADTASVGIVSRQGPGPMSWGFEDFVGPSSSPMKKLAKLKDIQSLSPNDKQTLANLLNAAPEVLSREECENLARRVWADVWQ